MLQGKTALVTGSTSGIGLGIAKALAQQGANIVLNGFGDTQVDAKAVAMGLSNEEAKKQLLQEKEPSMQFTTPEELGELAVFFCSAAGNNVRGVAWNMDGGWTAQ
eukprot:gene22974-26020_t